MKNVLRIVRVRRLAVRPSIAAMSRNPASCVVPAMAGAVTIGDGRAPVRTAPRRAPLDRAASDDGGSGDGGSGDGPATDRVCSLDVRSETLREALTHVACRDGWDVVRNQRPGVVTVRDRVVALEGEQSAARTVLVVGPQPLQCQRALRAFAAGSVAAVIPSDRPTELAHALLSVSVGWGAVPLRVLEVAAQMPDLSERQEGILGALMAGQTTAEIARGLYLSDASVKRELALLFRSFGSRNRLELAMLASDLGFRPVRLLP